MNAGRVWLVGAGPGDPDLITVRGARLLAAAGAVVHDRLVDRRLLALAPPEALRIDVGKEGHGPGAEQDDIGRLLIRLARTGLDVVRLKGGDPFVFGRGGEEVEALRAAGIAVEVVPGITAGIAGPAAAGIPITHRGIARSVAFVTGHRAGGADRGACDAGASDAACWASMAGIDTVVVYMAGRTAGAVARGLLGAGRSSATPVAVVADATLPGQVVVRTDLGGLADSGIPASVPAGRPVLLVIGEVVRVGDRFTPPVVRVPRGAALVARAAR